jgi:guanylate kinase
MRRHKRIILCGPTASGKTFIRNKFKEKGFINEVSYTSREPREGEINGVDYHFISNDEFMTHLVNGDFYEHTYYNGCHYATGNKEWNECEIFVMETDGLKTILPEDKRDCVFIYVDTPKEIRVKRMYERGWDQTKILSRIDTDEKKFKNFTDYDFKISS